MSPNNSPPQHPNIRTSACRSQPEEEEEEEDEDDLEKLESDVKEVVQKIHHCRTTLPDLLRNTLNSVLSAQRPVFPSVDSHPAEPPDAEGAEEDKETTEKLQLLRQQISSNVSTMPTLLKRMKECISRIDDISSDSQTIHPAFKKRRTS